MDTVQEVSRSIDDFQKRFCCAEYSSLSIEFNDHASSYEKTTDERFDAEHLMEFANFPSPEEYQKAIRENSVWILQWYPRTPIGSCRVGASTLEGALAFAYEVATNTKKDRM